MHWDVRRLVQTVWVVSCLAVAPRFAAAQYFGQNQVEYQSFRFRILKTDHFDIYYYPEEEAALRYVAPIAERAYARLSRLFDHQLSTRQVLILYASAPQFRETNVVSESGEGTGGVTETLKRRIVLPFAGPLKETDHVLTHELVHAFQFDMTGPGGGVMRAGGPAVQRLPLWFAEGMAEYLSIGPKDPNTTMWMREAVRAGKLPNLRRLQDPRFFPYRYGQAVWAYVGGRWGDEAIGKVLQAARRGDLKDGFRGVTHVPGDSVVAAWQRETKQEAEPVLAVTRGPGEYGRAVIQAPKGSGQYNVAPVLSPDGSQLIFLSSRDLFSIDMYLADTRTGKIVRRIVRTDVNPHFESIEFISSAGAWDASGERFVFAGARNGRPVLTILRVRTGKIEREIPLPELGEVWSPAWAPDGRRVAFSALVGGLSDLYVYDLAANQLSRLTDDAYADLQPAWSPDGRYLAWVTDRYSTRLDTLAYGNYRLAIRDVEADTTCELPGFPGGKHIDPQWTPDGKGLYFISDQNGIADVYRLELFDGRITQVTNLYAGASGITDLSPAITVASRSGQLGFSVYTNDGYSIYVADRPEVLAGDAVTAPLPGGDPAMLVPEVRESDVLALKANASFGLPHDTADYATRPYHSHLGLDYVAQPSLMVGADRFGTYLGGGATLFWSDMLGGHNLAAGLQAQGTLRDIGVLGAYTNSYHRLNWGVTLQQQPYLTGAAGYADTVVDSVPALIQQTLLYRQTSRQAGWLFAYPFSRVRRVEGTIGYANISYNVQLKRQYFDAVGNQIAQADTTLPSPAALNLAQASLATVYDNAVFGFTGAILGQRYRFELGTTRGDLDFQTVLGDYRRYFMPVRPFTLAGRIVHYGRYGGDAESNRLQPLYIGYDGLVRGYELGSFDFATECGGDSTCPSYSRLFGSKMAVANVELRFPPLGLFRAGGPFGFLPLDLYLFGDAGLAWNTGTKTENAFFLGGDRRPVYSAGAGLRFNLFGMAILELDLVHPFNRVRGTHLQFAFTPGF